MSNIEENVEEKKMGRDSMAYPQSEAPSRELSLEFDGYAAFLLVGLAQQFSSPPLAIAG